MVLIENQYSSVWLSLVSESTVWAVHLLVATAAFYGGDSWRRRVVMMAEAVGALKKAHARRKTELWMRIGPFQMIAKDKQSIRVPDLLLSQVLSLTTLSRSKSVIERTFIMGYGTFCDWLEHILSPQKELERTKLEHWCSEMAFWVLCCVSYLTQMNK